MSMFNNVQMTTRGYRASRNENVKRKSKRQESRENCHILLLIPESPSTGASLLVPLGGCTWTRRGHGEEDRTSRRLVAETLALAVSVTGLMTRRGPRLRANREIYAACALCRGKQLFRSLVTLFRDFTKNCVFQRQEKKYPTEVTNNSSFKSN